MASIFKFVWIWSESNFVFVMRYYSAIRQKGSIVK